MKPKRAAAARRPPTRGAAARIEERGLPIVRELARVARGEAPPVVKLEGAMEILFGAYGTGESEFPDLLLGGWMRAREDKHFRLTMAWLREQLRLSIRDILAEGVARGAFRRDLDPGAVAAVIVGTAEGCLLHSPSHGGAVPPADLVRTLLRLAVSGA